jgi:hypothetical protein
VNHPALVKTSDQPSFSSANFSPYFSPVPSPNLKPNPRSGTAKKIMSSPNKKFVEATQKKKIIQTTKSKPIGLRRMLFFVLQKDRREGFAEIQLRLTLHQIQTLT